MSGPTESTHPGEGEIAALAMLDASDAERARFEAHVAGCARCAAEWRRATRLASLMDGLAPPPPPSDRALARARARVHALLATEPGPAPVEATSPARGLAVAAAVLISVVAAFSLSGPPINAARVLLAVCTIGVAALLPSMALRSDRHALAATLSAFALSLGLARVDYAELAMVAGHAMGCLQAELMVGALPLVAMLFVSRASGRRASALATAAAGACGALAGQGVLLTSCAADESVLHVLFFHVAGVVVGALVGGGLGAVMARRAEA